MEVYTVGGAVRDRMLGHEVEDRDYVVVGATPDDMLASGFRPVGRDFPVFLHPDTHEEYALARTERKSAPGYRGFVFHADPTVTLAQDLRRRDLTINAMALSADGRLIDPWGGRADLERRLLRHVSPAFAEDPVRILRLARFAARFPDFAVADETLALCRRMVCAGEVDALVAERVWQELSRGLMASAPQRMFAVLDACGALERLVPELCGREAAQEALGRIAVADPLAVRWASLWVPPFEGAEARAAAVAQRLRLPNDCRELSLLAVREFAAVRMVVAGDAQALLALFERSDALRRPGRFEQLLRVVCLGVGDAVAGQVEILLRALAAARAVDAGAVARSAAARSEIPERVRDARLAAVAAAIGA
ncbi:MAG: multifunctional CCA tRNA nucleotidyl transferase/2'3'-cyclic phosphodiesterase/2'nucleotidase/phosphatase [Rhodocyclaceae bacterium]|nr:multifunctional CCA tRNA nucleotidyl transferase/2'3'-cyclic phosphodiesterase/2'nucleotidase/phosphatase [Rhodocyclaceae bacterium]